MDKYWKAHHSISWRCFRKTSRKAVHLGRLVVVRLHQLPPVLSTDFSRSLPAIDLCHPTSLPQFVIARDPMVPSSLDVPRCEISRSFVLVGIREQLFPGGVVDLEVTGWGFLIRDTNLN